MKLFLLSLLAWLVAVFNLAVELAVAALVFSGCFLVAVAFALSRLLRTVLVIVCPRA